MIKDRNALLTSVMLDVAPYVDAEKQNKEDPTADYHAVAAKCLLDSLFKKWEVKSERADATAVLTFLEANYLSASWRLPALEEAQKVLIGEIRRELDDFLHPQGGLLVDSFLSVLEKGYTGPGSSVGAVGQSMYAKLGCSPLTATSITLCEMYSAYASMFPTWASAESARIAQLEHAFAVVDGSRMSLVPKNVDTARAICVEPGLNMFFQLGVKELLEERLRSLWNVDLSIQPELNRLLARLGSKSGSYSTLDLSSASDRISVELCRTLLPRSFFETLMEIRVGKTSIVDYGLEPDLGMMSTMGNGFTFPLMTLILSCAVRAVYRVKGIPIRDNPRTYDAGYNVPGNWAVFGDDIIVCSEAYDDVVACLQLLGLQVNISKSFNQGPFRESCGHDYFSGRDVRGVYLKKLTSRQDVAIAVNLLNDWSYRTGIPLRNACVYLLEGLSLPFVPYADSVDSGVRVPSCIWGGKHRLQKVCYKAWLAKPKCITFSDEGAGNCVTSKGFKKWFVNSSMLLMSLLSGELRNGKISIRSNGTIYQTRWRVTPNWDFMPMSVWVNPRTDWPRWETAVVANIGDDLKG